MRNRSIISSVFMAILASVLMPRDVAAETLHALLRRSLRVVYELSDGSRIVGRPSVYTMQMHAWVDGGSRLRTFPLEKVRKIDFQPDRETVQVVLQDDQELKGVIESLPLELSTALLGTVKLKRDSVRNLTVDLGIRAEVYTDRKRFEKRLDKVRVVDFDDVDTADVDFTSFAADRYKEKLGIVIRGSKGQFAGRAFGYPDQFVPRSAPNSYAPGPVAKPTASRGSGGHQTDVTFAVGGGTGMVSGFGAVFIDADHPHMAASSLSVYVRYDSRIATEAAIRGGNGQGVFRGIVTVDRDGRPVPVIDRVRLVNGGNWPVVQAGEGVTLDDFVFSAPVVRSEDE